MTSTPRYDRIHACLSALEKFGVAHKENIFLGLAFPLAMITSAGHTMQVKGGGERGFEICANPYPHVHLQPLDTTQLAASSIEEAIVMEGLAMLMEMGEYFTYMKGVSLAHWVRSSCVTHIRTTRCVCH